MATAKKATPKGGKSYDGFTAEERAAMKEHAKEMKAAQAGADAEAEVLAKIAEMDGSDRAMAEKIHAIVKKVAPELTPQTWYGQPAYKKNGKVVCFFQAKAKFKTRYATFGFQEAAQLDEGGMWPTSYALTKLSAADEKRIAELVKKAAG
ncbi:MAG: DUF1801 domain-containing protein [Hamadaea sp.]|uniref:iron chaperone n=1 Tax=Hamadaea sp. TaxID=2024425 RepID=UPI0017F47E29|nr:DUF1801 domain-containing protein [Hamadaea sp.]NUR71724.1 DUF1801 domain-containing protein [Hamadaea sp.]NUT19038.1 DUF1801 domain-containing protein [Hamadaea sp.]